MALRRISNTVDVDLLLKQDCERRAIAKLFHHRTNETTDPPPANLRLDKTSVQGWDYYLRNQQQFDFNASSSCIQGRFWSPCCIQLFTLFFWNEQSRSWLYYKQINQTTPFSLTCRSVMHSTIVFCCGLVAIDQRTRTAPVCLNTLVEETNAVTFAQLLVEWW